MQNKENICLRINSLPTWLSFLSSLSIIHGDSNCVCAVQESRVVLVWQQLSEEKPKQTIYANVYWNRINNRDSQLFLSPIFFKGGGICTQAMYWKQVQGAKKIIFTASPKSFLTSRIHFTILLLFEFLKKITCTSGKLKTEFTSPKAKSTSPGLSDTTFFARWGQTCSSHNSHRTS